MSKDDMGLHELEKIIAPGRAKRAEQDFLRAAAVAAMNGLYAGRALTQGYAPGAFEDAAWTAAENLLEEGKRRGHFDTQP